MAGEGETTQRHPTPELLLGLRTPTDVDVAPVRGSVERVAWSSDGSTLLVVAADPGSYDLDWSARPVRGGEPDPDPIVRRRHRAWRRLFMVDLASGRAQEVGPDGLSVWEVD